MHNSFGVHVLECTCNLVNVSPYLLFLKAHFVFLSPLHDELQVSFLRPLYRNKQLVKLVVDKPVQILNDVGVI